MRHMDRQIHAEGELPTERFVGVRFHTAKTVIDVNQADDTPGRPAFEFAQEQRERHRIRSAGKRHRHSIAVGEQGAARQRLVDGLQNRRHQSDLWI